MRADLFSVVDYCDILSNLFEDLLKLYKFAVRAEDMTNNHKAKHPDQDVGL